MMLHTVLFWFKPGVTALQLQAFEAGVSQLFTISGIMSRFLGVPTEAHQPPVDASYSYQLTLGFADQHDHAAYEDDPTHLAFIERCGPLFAKVLIYDAE